jgi:hypothetical protein
MWQPHTTISLFLEAGGDHEDDDRKDDNRKDNNREDDDCSGDDRDKRRLQ